MELQFYGGNCIGVTSKGVRVIADDNLVNLGAKPVTKDGDVMLATSVEMKPTIKAEPKLVVDSPGEYEVAGVSIYGIAARSHMDEAGKTSTTMYKLVCNDLAILITGHIYPELSESQLEQIGEVDAMIVPVGGNGYTLDAVGALKLIRLVEPKLVIPTHYADSALKYEVPQQSLDQALKELAMEPKETTAKLKLKPGELSDVTQLVILDKA